MQCCDRGATRTRDGTYQCLRKNSTLPLKIRNKYNNVYTDRLEASVNIIASKSLSSASYCFYLIIIHITQIQNRCGARKARSRLSIHPRMYVPKHSSQYKIWKCFFWWKEKTNDDHRRRERRSATCGRMETQLQHTFAACLTLHIGSRQRYCGGNSRYRRWYQNPDEKLQNQPTVDPGA